MSAEEALLLWLGALEGWTGLEERGAKKSLMSRIREDETYNIAPGQGLAHAVHDIKLPARSDPLLPPFASR